MGLASENNQNDGFDKEDRKKYGIVEEIFDYPWNKRNENKFYHHARNVFESNLSDMDKV
jgi:hypothetical protein